jgi:type I restriction enzyme S subunit
MRPLWKTVPISELYEGLYDGPHATPKPSDAGPVFLGIKNVTDDGHLDLSDIRHIAEEDYSTWTRRVEPKPGDIVFTYEATLNRYAVIPQGFRGCLGRRMALIRTDPKKVDTGYLLYYFFAPAWREVIKKNMMTGATVDRIPLTTFPSFPVSLPPLPIQRRIAGILSAYDELIENNQRRIKILEQMARSLYREWFVNFRYPGHENVPLVPSPLGEIPQGWEVKAVADAFVISGGGTPSRKEADFWDGGTIQWYSPSDLTGAGTMFMDDSSDHITERGLAQSSARMFPAHSVMLTSRATIGAIAINTQPACTNQGFITCLPNDRVPLYFLFHWLTENVPTFQRMASGATFKEISRGVFKTIEFLEPPSQIVERFEAIAVPMAEQVLALQRQILNLRRTRDLLLPRLLSGQIDVEALPS